MWEDLSVWRGLAYRSLGLKVGRGDRPSFTSSSSSSPTLSPDSIAAPESPFSIDRPPPATTAAAAALDDQFLTIPSSSSPEPIADNQLRADLIGSVGMDCRANPQLSWSNSTGNSSVVTEGMTAMSHLSISLSADDLISQLYLARSLGLHIHGPQGEGIGCSYLRHPSLTRSHRH